MRMKAKNTVRSKEENPECDRHDSAYPEELLNETDRGCGASRAKDTAATTGADFSMGSQELRRELEVTKVKMK